MPTGFDPQLNIAKKSFGAIRNFKTDGGGPIKVALADDMRALEELLPGASEAVPHHLKERINNTITLTPIVGANGATYWAAGDTLFFQAPGSAVVINQGWPSGRGLSSFV